MMEEFIIFTYHELSPIKPSLNVLPVYDAVTGNGCKLIDTTVIWSVACYRDFKLHGRYQEIGHNNHTDIWYEYGVMKRKTMVLMIKAKWYLAYCEYIKDDTCEDGMCEDGTRLKMINLHSYFITPYTKNKYIDIINYAVIERWLNTTDCFRFYSYAYAETNHIKKCRFFVRNGIIQMYPSFYLQLLE